MANIDDIFEVRPARAPRSRSLTRVQDAGVPSKRKREAAIRDPNEIYKSSKLAADSSRRPNAPGADSPGSDAEAGPVLPPQSDPDDAEGSGDDDEGRFFGGGISKQESQMLDYVQGAAPDGPPEQVDAAWVRRTVQNLEKRIARNAELRAKYEGEPEKFIDSEADLDGDIKALSILTEHANRYREFVELGGAICLVGLLAHDNTDIAIGALEIIGELTDDDVPAEAEEWDALVFALLDADLVELLVSNLSRLHEDDEADRRGVYYALGIIENLCSSMATAARLAREHNLLQWLLHRIQEPEPVVSENKQHAAQTLAILAGSSAESLREVAQLDDAVDTLLQLVAPYRKWDPDRGGYEGEYMENLFETLTCLADEPAGKAKLVEAEGVELCMIMLREGKRSRAPALRLLDHATGGGSTAGGADVCARLVSAGGLRPVFTLFGRTPDRRLLVHLLSIIASMLRLLPARCDERIRLLAKFVEKDYEKIARLVQLHAEYAARIRQAEAEHAQAPAEDPKLARLQLISRRHDAGLFNLQFIDTSLAWLLAEDEGARHRIVQLLAERGEGLAALAATLQAQRDALDMAQETSRALGEMLGTLLEFLQ